MAEFNNGDKVRIVKNIWYGEDYDRFIGTKDSIDYIDNDGDIYLVNRENKDDHWIGRELELVEEAKETVEFKEGDDVKVTRIDVDENDEQYMDTLGKTGRLIKNDESSIPYKVYFKDIDEYFWYRRGQIELAKNPEETMTEAEETMTYEEALKIAIDGTKVCVADHIYPESHVYFDKCKFVWHSGLFGDDSDLEERWQYRQWKLWIPPQPKPNPKFQSKQLVANAMGDIGIITEHTGYHGNIPEYSVRFNGVTEKTKPVLESELSEVVL